MKYILLISILFLSLWGQAQNYFFLGQNQLEAFNFETYVTQVGSSVQINSASGGGDVRIEWGDGSFDDYEGGVTVLDPATHTYSSSDTYNIVIKSRTSLQFFNCANQNITTIDASQNTSLISLEGQNNDLTSISFTIGSTLDFLTINNNNISTTVVNFILVQFDNSGITNGRLDLNIQTPPAPPSGSGITAKNNLIGKGWSVSTD